MLNASLSGDRIFDEVTKILATGSVGVNLLSEVGILGSLLPEVEALRGIDHGPHHQEGDPFQHTMLVLDHYVGKGGNNPLILWALLLHDIGKVAGVNGTFHGHEELSAAMSAKILEKMIGKGLNRDSANVVTYLVENHMRGLQAPKMKPAKRGRMFDNPNFPLLLEVLEADSMGKIPQQSSDVQKVRDLYNAHKAVFAGPAGPSLKALGINGNTLMNALGVAPGPVLGNLLSMAQDMLYENPGMSREDILQALR